MNATLVYVGDQIQMQACTLYAHHSAIVETHHVCPNSWFAAAGIAVNTPLKVLCGNCHNDTHAAIDGILRGSDISKLPPRSRALAAQAFDIATAAGIPVSALGPTL